MGFARFAVLFVGLALVGSAAACMTFEEAYPTPSAPPTLERLAAGGPPPAGAWVGESESTMDSGS